MSKRIVITGMGVVAPNGVGLEAFEKAIKAGALGAGISGAGPTIFALCNGDKSVVKVKDAIQNAYADKNIDFTLFSSNINQEGIKIIATN